MLSKAALITSGQHICECVFVSVTFMASLTKKAIKIPLNLTKGMWIASAINLCSELKQVLVEVYSSTQNMAD